MTTVNIFRRQNPPENADAIWHLHGKAKSLVDETVDSDIVRVLRVAIEALAAAGAMADSRNAKAVR